VSQSNRRRLCCDALPPALHDGDASVVTSARLADVSTATVVSDKELCFSAQCECCFISHASKFDLEFLQAKITFQ